MPRLCLALIPLAMLISLPLTAVLIAAAHRLRIFDSAGVPGQVKLERRRVPNLGGVAIFWAICLPVMAGLSVVRFGVPGMPIPASLDPYTAGIREQTPLALLLVGSLFLLHLLGLVDDRRPLGPGLKFTVMALPAFAIPMASDTRLLTLLDAHVGGPWLSIAATTLWILVVTNAL